jgi:hypothetical protein
MPNQKGVTNNLGEEAFPRITGRFFKNDEEKVPKGKTRQTKRENTTIDKIPERLTFSEVLHLPFLLSISALC